MCHFTRSLAPLFLGLAFALPAIAADDPLPASSFAHTYGRYAPDGDCSREPQVVVAASGLEITVNGSTEKITQPDVAWAYGGNFYEGSSRWLFPYSGDDRPVLMSLDADEKTGVMHIAPHDRGSAGVPALSARHQALVDGSPYLRCGAGV